MSNHDDHAIGDGRFSPPPPAPMTQDFQHSAIGARVPEDISHGAFSNAVLIIQAHDMFAMDFLSTVTHPHQVVSRVILPAKNFGELLAALRANVIAYERKSGPLAPPSVAAVASNGISPKPSEDAPEAPPRSLSAGTPPSGTQGDTPPQPRINELYDQLRLSDKIAGGVFANVALIRHTQHEFALDFICSLYPKAVVNARVFIPAPRIPNLIEAIASSLATYQQRTKPKQPDDPGIAPV